MTTRYAFGLLFLLQACVEEPAPPTTPPPDPNPDALQVRYTFEDGDGLIVHDVSGIEPAFDLHLDNLVTNKWLPDGGIEILGPSVITSPEIAEKLFVACVQANAVSLELWIEPAMAAQANTATIFTYSKQDDRNVTIHANETRYRGSVRTSNPDPMQDGPVTQTIETPLNVTAAAAQHVVFTRDTTGANLYVNGADAIPPPTTPPTMPPPATDQSDWSPAYQLTLGNETSGNRPWLGKIYLAAVYAKKLTAAEVAAKYATGY